jgi:hypothetical protein
MPNINHIDADDEQEVEPSVDNNQPNADNNQLNAAKNQINLIKPTKYLNFSTLKEQLNENNWSDWTRRIIPVLEVCGVWEYVNGEIAEPDKQTDPISAQNWKSNSNLAKLLVMQNISKDQLQHIDQKLNAAQVWESITSLHQATGFRTGVTWLRTLYSMRVAEDEDILEFINKMKTLIADINAMHDDDLGINDKTFSGILMAALPHAWDQFVDSLHQTRASGGAPVPRLNIVQLIRHIKDEYYHRIGCKDDEALHGKQQSNVAVAKSNTLANRISDKDRSSLYCKCCKKSNHCTDDCRHLGKALCDNCGRFGHNTDACWQDGKQKCKRDDNTQNKQNERKDNRPQKKGKWSNVVDEEESAMSIEQGAHIENPPNNEEEMYKFYEASDIEDYVSFSENDNLLLLYIECLPDSGSTSHVFHQRDMFTDYRLTDNITVGGVGGNRT